MKTTLSTFNLAPFRTAPKGLSRIVLSLLGLLAAFNASAVGNVVISQVCGGGGGTGYYRYDYVELYNRTDAAVTMPAWSIQYAAASGNFSSVYAIPAGTVIPAGGYLLVQVSSAGSSGLPFPVPADLTTTALNMAQNSGKVALANTTTALGAVSSLPDSRIVDFVGYGAANLGEGGTEVNNGAALNNMQGCVRKMAGYRDTDNNNLDFDVVTAPVPRNSRAGKLHFFASNLLPPTNGVYSAQPGSTWAYANGYIVSNFVQRLFTGSIPPPPPGALTSPTFGFTAEFELSVNNGLTWQPVSTPYAGIQVQVASNSTVGGYAVYTNALTSSTISGGGLPSGVIIRQNPGTNSPGQTRIQTIPGGCMLSSFFDIFTQISTDNGNTWLSATNGPTHLEVKPDPALVAATPAPRTVMPMPDGQYLIPGSGSQRYLNGIMLTNIKHKLFTAWMEPPAFGSTNTQTLNSQLDCQFSQDGGLTFMPVRAPVTMTFKINNARGFQNQSTYETEVAQFDVSGGDLPLGVRLRVSPNNSTTGGTWMLAGGGGGGAGGGAAISSFFDIFTQISTDNGNTWLSATNGPAHLELQRIAPANLFTNNLFPPLAGTLVCTQQWFAYYLNGIVITNMVLGQFSAAISPPSSGGNITHSFGSTVEFDLSQDGGLSYTHTSSPAAVTVAITNRLGDDGTTIYYDTEMSQFDVSGGGLPGGVQIRESPTKASLGRTTSSAVSGGASGYQIDSFFDVYTEVSVDGGQTWQPTVAGPATITLKPSAPTSSVLGITCPSNMVVTTTSPAGAVVYYTPLVSGTCPPFTTNCVPPGGSTFPIGVTTVTCAAKDACGQQTNCGFTVTVVPRPLGITCPTNMTVTATNPAGAIVLYAPSVTGGCPSINTNCNPPSGSIFPIGTTTVNCTATDACGQQTNCSFTITVAPRPLSITCPSNITGRATNPAGAVVTYTVTGQRRLLRPTAGM